MGSIPATKRLLGGSKIRRPNILEWEEQNSEGDVTSMLGLNEARSFTLEISAFTWTIGVLFLGTNQTKTNKKKQMKRGKKDVSVRCFVRCFGSNIWRLRRRQIVYMNLYIHEYAHIHIIRMYMYKGTIYTYISSETITHIQTEKLMWSNREMGVQHFKC